MRISGGGWLSLLTAVLFAAHIGCLHHHLFSEAHFHDGMASLEPGLHAEAEHGDHHEDGHHNPHAAADHAFQMAVKKPGSPLTIFFLATDAFLILPPPDAPLTQPRSEAPPGLGESPPGPLQPRAPPLV
jgi:hypothetical protein